MVLALFTLSGLAGLIYQSVWAHYLALLLGNAAYAQGLVLATFMGGMGLGGVLAARFSAGWRRLIRVYAGVEILLGALGLIFHGAFVLVQQPLLGMNSGSRWLAAIAMILPQSILLGLSFPVMSAGLMRLLEYKHGRILGNTYFCNSAGAALGALIATFILLPRIGLPGSLQFAGLLNLLIGILAWLMGGESRAPVSVTNSRESLKAQALGIREAPNGLLLVILTATALSSAASFVYEIAWIRMLSLAVGTTLHSFELMLAAFIGGMALGGLWIRSRADRYTRPLAALGWIQLAMGGAAVLSLLIYATSAFEWVGYLGAGLARSDSGYTLYNAGTVVAAIAVMLPAAFFAGATLPLFTNMLLRKGYGESVIGRVYAWNTLGAILGIFAAIHWLIPSLGLRNAVIMAAGLDMLIGVALLLKATDHPRRFPASFAGAAGAVLMLAAGTHLIHFDPLKLASGVFRSGTLSLDQHTQMAYYEDGKTASVSMYINETGDYGHIANNGKVDAALALEKETPPTADEPTMVMAGAIPLMLHPDPERIAIIGMGSGLTTHTLLADSRPRTVNTIEIEPKMVEAARLFGDRVSRAWSDQRSQIVIDDAKAYLAGPIDPFDIIVSEPSNPWMSGVGSLFAEEFYGYIRDRLAPDGLFVQWLQLYEIDEALVGSVLAAMTPNFDHMRAWMANDTDLLIVASMHPIGELDTSLMGGDIGAELRQAGLSTADQVRLRAFGDAVWLSAINRVIGSEPNSYFFPKLSLDAPRTRFRQDNADLLITTAAQQPVAAQLLGVGGPLPAPETASTTAHFSAERRTARALLVIQALGGSTLEFGSIDPDNQRLLEQVELLGAWSKNCRIFQSRAGTSRWLGLYSIAVQHSLPYLDSAAARPLYQSGSWLRCAQLPPAVSSAIDLAESLAFRAPPEIIVAARRWLDLVLKRQASGAFLTDSAYLSGQAAHLADGYPEKAGEFRAWYASAPPLAGNSQWLNSVLGEYAVIQALDQL